MKQSLQRIKYLWRKQSAAIIAALVLVIIILLGILAPFIYAPGPLAMDSASRFQGPSGVHWLGADEYGRDVLSRTCYGIRISLLIGSVVVMASTVLGVVIGVLCGYYPSVDRIVSRILDGLMAFPEIILAITLAAIWGSGTGNIIFALTFAYFPKMARVVRGSVLAAKEQEYVQSALAVGAGTGRLIWRYIFPGCISPIIVQATFCFASAVLSEAALSFLGVGIKEPAPSLGNMVSVGRNSMSIAPWIILAPGGMIMLIVLALNILGDGLRDALDPKY